MIDSGEGYERFKKSMLLKYGVRNYFYLEQGFQFRVWVLKGIWGNGF